MVASTVVFVRIFIEIGTVAPAVLRHVAAPLATMAALNIALSGIAFWLWGRSDAHMSEPGVPTELKAALIFGALYGVVLLAVAAAKAHLGAAGLYAVAAVSGLTDVDAITLSMANLADAGRVSTDTAWRAILLAALTNLGFKGCIAFALGGTALSVRIGPLFGCSIVAGTAILVAWP
jgi:uncharacterized membrane protein (DUF4010 family)